MKSLLDIQQKVKDLENGIKEISNSIKEINEDINALRDTGNEADIDYETIDRLSKNMPFKKHPLKSVESGYVCRIYLEMLFNIVRIDMYSKSTMSRLIFIQWILNQADIKMTLEEAFVDCCRMEGGLYQEFVTEVSPNLYKFFVVDALIVANIDGTANQGVLAYIANLCGILGIEREKLYSLSLISKIILCQGVDTKYQIEPKDLEGVEKDIKPFKNYIYVKKDIINDLRIACRRIVVEVDIGPVFGFDWTVQNKKRIKKGDTIFKYTEIDKINKAGETMMIKAPVDGTIFIFQYYGVCYGVISDVNDDLESIKEWVKEEINNGFN